MKELTPKAHAYIDDAVRYVFGGSKIKGADLYEDGDNPFSYLIEISMQNDEKLVLRKCNELFHLIGLLPEDRSLVLGEQSDFCEIVKGGNSDGEIYVASFNHPAVFDLSEDDPEIGFVLKNWRQQEERDEDKEPAEIKRLVDGIKDGVLKSKSTDGYLVLKGEFYDAIELCDKTVEYRDFTEYNIKRTIGIKTIRFNRGYVKNAPQMQWTVEKVVLLDGEGGECDPFDVPEDFCPTAIAIHLGKRIG